MREGRTAKIRAWWRRDVRAYASDPLTHEELAVADLAVAFDLGDDDVDYDATYARRR